MPPQKQININKTPNGPPAVIFDPNPLDVNVRDQIFWTNNDTEPHWPGLADDTGKVTNPSFFMPNQIAPNGDQSAPFGVMVAGTLKYACSLHTGENGTINVK